MVAHLPTALRKNRAFTLIELLVVVSILGVLAALLLPVANRIMQQGRTTKCAEHLKVIGNAAMLYAADHQMTLPVSSHQRSVGGTSWSISLQPYAAGTLVFRCPCDEDSVRVYSYVLNDFLTPNPAGAPDLDYSRLSRLDSSREVILFGEAAQEYKNSDHFHFSDYRGMKMPPDVFAQQVAVKRHGGSANYLFADGHVETWDWERVQTLLREDKSRLVDPSVGE